MEGVLWVKVNKDFFFKVGVDKFFWNIYFDIWIVFNILLWKDIYKKVYVVIFYF